MAYAPKIVLVCRPGTYERLDQLVEDFIRDGVKFVGIAGVDCERAEELIDEIVIGDGGGHTRFILTSSHPGESVEEVIAFAAGFQGEFEGDVQIVELD